MPTLRDATAEAPAPVRALAMALTDWIGRLGTVWIEGQITQINRRPGLQTVFMTLRDTHADVSVPVTCARTLVDGLNPPLVEGGTIVVLGQPDYYPNRGSLSLKVREIRLVGLGELLARIERRRQLLAAEGLFDPALKRPLPFLPGCVGLVTAPNSAAERDVLENTRRRWPAVRFEVAHAAVQGTRAVPELLECLDRLERNPQVEAVIIARGGGSVEDLLPFSDEALIRAVHRMRTPVVSAIGHEPDSPLLDLVADVRASTPTAAASLIVPDVAEELLGVAHVRERIRRALAIQLDREQAVVTQLRSRPAMANPGSLIELRQDEVQGLVTRSRRSIRHLLDRATDDVAHQRARAQAMSPLATLQRGYAILQDADGHVVTSVAALAPGDPVSARVGDGRVHATTTSLEEDPDEQEHE